MKASAIARTLVVGLTLHCLAGQGAAAQGTAGGSFYRQHFAGASQLAADANSALLKKIWALLESRQLRDHVFQKLAQAPYAAWRQTLPAGAADPAALLRPLLDDLAVAESYVELQGPPGRTEVALAVRLTEERAQSWNTNLWRAAQALKWDAPNVIKLDTFAGWQARKKGAPNVFQFARAGQWVLVGLGSDRLTLLPAWAQQIAKAGRPGSQPGAAWLTAEVDFPRLAQYFPSLAKFDLPPAQVTVAGRDQNVRMEARLVSKERITWTFEPWKIPTNFVQDPLISFTVARGVAPLLSKLSGLPALGLNPVPNQFCLWGQMNEHVQTCLAVPYPNASNAFRQIGQKVPAFVNGQMTDSLGEFAYLTNRNELILKRAPFVLPGVRPIRAGGNEFLLGSLYPVSSKGRPVPAELFQQLSGRNNLVYYDWEITGERLPQQNRMLQLISISTRRQLPPTNYPTLKWIVKAAPLLGNTVTEITQTQPNELSLVRKSPLGLTGHEIAVLTRWIESPGFPLTYDPPPVIRTGAQKAGKTSTPPKR